MTSIFICANIYMIKTLSLLKIMIYKQYAGLHLISFFLTKIIGGILHRFVCNRLVKSEVRYLLTIYQKRFQI